MRSGRIEPIKTNEIIIDRSFIESKFHNNSKIIKNITIKVSSSPAVNISTSNGWHHFPRIAKAATRMNGRVRNEEQVYHFRSFEGLIDGFLSGSYFAERTEV